MKISSAPVSRQTHVRPAQVGDMIRHCKAVQETCDRLAHCTIRNARSFLDVNVQPDWNVVAMQWPSQPEVVAFREAALNNHFVCANWKTFDQLQGRRTDRGRHCFRAGPLYRCTRISCGCAATSIQ